MLPFLVFGFPDLIKLQRNLRQKTKALQLLWQYRFPTFRAFFLIGRIERPWSKPYSSQLALLWCPMMVFPILEFPPLVIPARRPAKQPRSVVAA
jgi:hypothetical protein